MVGHTTRDVLALGHPHPAEATLPAKEHEAVIRRLGTWWTISGAAVLVLAVIAALAVALADRHSFLTSPTGALFTHLAGMLLAAIGTSLFVAGLMERIQQPQRTLIRHAMTRALANADVLEELSETMQRVSDAMVALSVGMAKLEEVVASLPDYGQGVIDGAQMRTNALYSEDN